MRDGSACGAERLGESSPPIGLPNLACYLTPRRILASETTSTIWSGSYRFVIRSAHKSVPHCSCISHKECSMSKPSLQGTKRFIAIDIHKHYLMVGAIDGEQRIVMVPRKVELQRWLAWAQSNLLPSDEVVLEATTNAWAIYDQVVTLVSRA